MTDWNRRFMDMAEMVASWSKDRSRGVGAVIVGADKTIRSVGYNGFPRGLDDDVECRHERPAKYKWTEHAERNAIYNAIRAHSVITGCTIVIPWYPCADCARAIIQAGIVKVVSYRPNYEDPTWGEDFKMVDEMLAECEIEVEFIPGAMKEAA